MNKVIIKQNRFKTLLMVLGSVAFVWISLHFVDTLIEGWNMPHNGDRLLRNKEFVMVMSIIAILFFGVCGLGWLYTLIFQGDYLVITDSGFKSYAMKSEMPWSNVEAIADTSVATESFLGVRLHDKQSYLQSDTWVKRKLHRANSALSIYHIAIPYTHAAKDKKYILTAMQKHWNAYREANCEI